jgi:hypothetical protein
MQYAGINGAEIPAGRIGTAPCLHFPASTLSSTEFRRPVNNRENPKLNDLAPRVGEIIVCGDPITFWYGRTCLELWPWH